LPCSAASRNSVMSSLLDIIDLLLFLRFYKYNKPRIATECIEHHPFKIYSSLDHELLKQN
ncbi:TPA: hypothetical protein ACIYRA_005920, partial [Escherichia coli]